MRSDPQALPAYRPEIDGLRTVAVLPVLLFHAGYASFAGGFVGVDVFFVISGYLITSIIIREVARNEFSVSRFYERRARRILPAFFFVMACCLPLAWLLMLPDELKRFGQSLVAATTYWSNVYFYLKTDYFAPAAEQQPLLHTWSLAVEEQFYVLFPLALSLSWRFGKVKAFAAASVLFLLSLGWASLDHGATQSSRFYLLHTRAWELIAGSLLAFLPPDRAAKIRRGFVSQAGALLGLSLILYSVVGFSDRIPYPGLHTTLPILGTVLVLAFASSSNLVGQFLSTRVLVGIGLMSYSVYLWHQPLFAFSRLCGIWDRVPAAGLVLSAAALVLAKLTTEFVEAPFRTRSGMQCPGGRRRMLAFAVACSTFLCCIGLTLHMTGGKVGLPYQMARAQIDQLGNDRWPYWENQACNDAYPFANKVGGWWFCMLKERRALDVFLVGDSHANDLYAAFIDTPPLTHLNVLSAGTCSYLTEPKPKPDVGPENPCGGNSTVEQFGYTTSIIQKGRPRFVFLNEIYPRDLSSEDAADFTRRAVARAKEIKDLGLTPVMLLPRPRLESFHVKQCFPRPLVGAPETCRVSRLEAMRSLRRLSTKLSESADVAGVLTLSQEDFFCSGEWCEFTRNGMPLIRDSEAEHLSPYGAGLFGEFIATWAMEKLPQMLEPGQGTKE